MNCPNHPDRPVVDAGVCTKQKCQECIDWIKDGYVDFKRPHWYEGLDHGAWKFEAGYAPSTIGERYGYTRTDQRSK